MKDNMPMNVLLLHPEFPDSFWSFKSVLDLVGRHALNPPLGLVTVAAMLPEEWSLRLVDCAVRPPSEEDWRFAEMVMITGMIVQKPSIMQLIAEAKRRGVPVVAGGPYATSVPQDFEEAGADYLVLDEAEITLAPFLDEIAAHGARIRAPGEPARRYTAGGKKPDLTQSPVPRFDLLELSAYDSMAVQYSRGCPFLCEFCDIITLYGRKPRTKSNAQITAELETLLKLGWRGGIFLVDDNFIGNKPNVRKLLPELETWQAANSFPFWFDTEASIDLAADSDLLQAMVRSGFASVFIGIETPDEDSLELTRKHQNNRKPMSESLETISRSGLRVMAGMILGFDNEKPGAGERIVRFVEENAIATALISLLQVLPNTGLYTRLEREERLTGRVVGAGQMEALNFIPTRPATEILREYVAAYRALYDPERYMERVKRQFLMVGIDPPFDVTRPPATGKPPRRSPATLWRLFLNDLRMYRAGAVLIWRLGIKQSATRRLFWRNLFEIRRKNPERLVTYLAICAHIEHFMPLVEKVASAIEEHIDRLGKAGHMVAEPALVPAPVLPRALAGKQ